MAARPLPDDDGAGLFADARRAEGETGDGTGRRHAHLQAMNGRDELRAGQAWADAVRGVRGQRRGDDVPRRVHRGGAGELHWLAMRRLLHEGIYVAAEARSEE